MSPLKKDKFLEKETVETVKRIGLYIISPRLKSWVNKNIRTLITVLTVSIIFKIISRYSTCGPFLSGLINDNLGINQVKKGKYGIKILLYKFYSFLSIFQKGFLPIFRYFLFCFFLYKFIKRLSLSPYVFKRNRKTLACLVKFFWIYEKPSLPNKLYCQ